MKSAVSYSLWLGGSYPPSHYLYVPDKTYNDLTVGFTDPPVLPTFYSDITYFTQTQFIIYTTAREKRRRTKMHNAFERKDLYVRE